MSDEKREVRFGTRASLRAEGAETCTVEGYAVVFGEETEIGDMFRERIMPGAFTAALAQDPDVTFLINHSGLPLARTSSGTLTLAEDAKGLRIESDLDPDDPDVQRIVPKMRRGDLTKMSFAFLATRQEWDDTQDPPLRTIHEAEIFDVSIVTDPAYEGTSIALRALECHRAADPAARLARMRMRTRLAG